MFSSKIPFLKEPFYLSYTSISDFLKCPRSFYLKNVYRDPKSNFRLQLASPYLSLGSTVHDTVAWYLQQKKKPGIDEVIKKYKNFWLKFHGKKGGFSSLEEEALFGQRGISMLKNFVKYSSCLEQIVKPLSFPKVHLIENMILLGNIDYVGQRDDKTLHIIDFKTGVKDEDSALQLYIYALLAESNYLKDVSKISFWYLDRDHSPKEAVLDPLDKTFDFLKEKALQIKHAFDENKWSCLGQNRCDCAKYEALIKGQGEFMFADYKYKKDIYYLQR